MQLFEISVILYVSADLLFSSFIGRIFTNLHQIWRERVFLRAIYTEKSNF